jgi:hypothetical protein
MKKVEMERLKGARIENAMRRERLPAGASAAIDRREQRRRDQAAGLVPFAVKLHGDLVKRIHALAQARNAGINEVVTELLEKGLDES